MIELFREILYKPLFNLTVFLYNILPGDNLGLAIIVLTILIRIVFFPLSVKTLRSQRALNALSPRVKEIKEKFKDNKSAQSAAILQLYKENGVNPFSGCLPLLIQIPILIALYRVFIDIPSFGPESTNVIYSFIENPGVFNKIFLGVIDVTARNPALALLAGGLQYFQAREANLQSKSNQAVSKEMSALSGQMLYFFPILIIVIGWNLPAGLMLYWVATTAFSILEQLYIKARYKK